MTDLQHDIIEWYNTNKRDFPWRNTKNPYFIWLSEIILQQTRALQGLPYYIQFTEQYPTVNHLANASLDEVLKTWQGLGYYSRARNLHTTAKYISEELNGVFPSSYSEIIKLKGIGPYTAAAIASFAFNEKKAVVDGNVYRVLSRYFADATPIDSSEGKNKFQQLADELISSKNPDLFNQATMELGATVCAPKNPTCTVCPIEINCISKQENQQGNFPVKTKKTKIKDRFLTYFIFKQNEKYIVKQRVNKDIWEGLFDFPVLDSPTPILEEEINEYLKKRTQAPITHLSSAYKHLLSHQKLMVQFVHVNNHPELVMNEFTVTNFEEIALPRIIDKYLEQLK